MKKYQIPEPKGKYAVGTLTYTVYNDRKETLPEHEDEMRSVAVRVYYPAEKESVTGLEKEQNISRVMAEGISKAFMVKVDYDKSEAKGENRSNCYRNAPHVPETKFPLIVFNHGYYSYREGNSFLCLELASHGYVVMSVAHSHEAVATEFDDGTNVLFENKIKKWMYSKSTLKVVCEMNRLKKFKGSLEDRVSAIDKWQKGSAGYLNGRIPEWEKDVYAAVKYAKENMNDFIDFSSGIGVAGHSMGGAVAYALCQDDPEFVCAANLDGALFGDHDGKIMKRPYLQINCRPNVPLIYRGFVQKEAPAYRIIFENMQHLGFSDLKHVIPVKMMVGKLDPDLAHDNVCRCHLEFFDAYLKHSKFEPDFPESECLIIEKF